MIEFVNIKTGERKKLDRPHQIGAYINSSDMHTNSNKGQDFGWRLSEEIVLKIDEMRTDIQLLERMADRTGIPVDELTTINLVQEISRQQDIEERTAKARAERDSEYKQEYEARIEKLREAKKPKAEPKVEKTETKPATKKK